MNHEILIVLYYPDFILAYQKEEGTDKRTRFEENLAKDLELEREVSCYPRMLFMIEGMLYGVNLYFFDSLYGR